LFCQLAFDRDWRGSDAVDVNSQVYGKAKFEEGEIKDQAPISFFSSSIMHVLRLDFLELGS
jgi:hypothetical protein